MGALLQTPSELLCHARGPSSPDLRFGLITEYLKTPPINRSQITSHLENNGLDILTERILDLGKCCGVGRFAVSSLVDGYHSELILIAFQRVGVDELGALDRRPCDLHPARVVGGARLDHVAYDGRSTVGHRLRPRDLYRVSTYVAYLRIAR